MRRKQRGVSGGRQHRILQGRQIFLNGICLWAVMWLFASGLCVSAAPADERKEERSSTTSQLYAQSAVLMDADNGRVLLEKNGDQILPMASTTKIMTCILTLEQGNTREVASVSSYAAGQPKVHLGARKGECYRIGDLLYSLMLESHNDAAVIIAEHFGSKWAGLSQDCREHSAEESKRAVLCFTQKMNEKAARIGCQNTFFVTPNGLDATLTTEKNGETVQKNHTTTAQDLARIMSYCITDSPARKEFLKITQTPNYQYTSFREGDDGMEPGNRSISCLNHNAFLQMMDGALTGKTGFTGKAGYCYVGAVQKDGKTFAVALLACGWPGHKSWKWHDMRLLAEYGLNHYDRHDIFQEKQLDSVPVEQGIKEHAELGLKKEKILLLLGPGDCVEVRWELPAQLTAPVTKGETVGKELYYVNEKLYASVPVKAMENVPKITAFYCIRKILFALML